MASKKPITELKAGDQVRVTHLPPGQIWYSTREDLDLANGEILTLNNPPFFRATSSMVRGFTEEEYALRYKPYGWIPYEWVDPVDPIDHQVCTCNIMVTGCICGAFQREKESHG